MHVMILVANRVADPHWFNADPDPDPAFVLIADPDSGSVSRIRDPARFWWPKFDKNLQLEIKFLFSWSKIATYLSLGLHKGRPSYMMSLQPSKENIQHRKFCTFFYFCGSLCPPGSGSAIWIPIRIRIQQLKLLRIHADPDPQPWLLDVKTNKLYLTSCGLDELYIWILYVCSLNVK